MDNCRSELPREGRQSPVAFRKVQTDLGFSGIKFMAK